MVDNKDEREYWQLTPAERWELADGKKQYSMGKTCRRCGGPVQNKTRVLTCQPCRRAERRGRQS